MSSSSGSLFGDACPLTITPAQLQTLNPDSVAILDASWHMPNAPRNPHSEWLSLRIPGSHFLDLDAVASAHELGLKHMMPSPQVFAEACETFGITPRSHVVIYDTHGIFSSPRALFMFRAFGHYRSSILDGGLPAWVAHGCPTRCGEPGSTTRSNYWTPQLDTDVVTGYNEISSNARYDPAREPIADIVLDARSRERYLGTGAEPRPGLSSGHIPYSFSLPFTMLLDTQRMPTPLPVTSLPVLDSDPDAKPSSSPARPPFPAWLPETYTTLKSTTRLISAIQDALSTSGASDVLIKDVLESHRNVIASCGSGMTAGVVWLALRMLGVGDRKKRVGIYDESWTGYAMRPESKIVKEDNVKV
ncbi:uncharacterized protein FIBRA_04283 [Fibroporia radiculosa]|uniref:Rhodanese domain-containing protein n=1 Tax=Fibroporia radiculosa TaxID=599839 RepID=J4G748_9APHY|nr:uncharacterized protein FIBRA_04283 [Fibroporia radiculosa]CCM02203.1 predicted protein [Fibroporia radiculosa]